jgi:GH18 family chitinase
MRAWELTRRAGTVTAWVAGTSLLWAVAAGCQAGRTTARNEAVRTTQEAITGGRRIVAYVPKWYGTNSNPDPSTIPSQVTHINVAFAGIDKNYNCAFWTDYQQADGPAQDYSTTVPPLISTVNTAHPGIAILLSVGGWTLSYRFSTAMSDATHRTNFINSCITLMNQYGFDGLDFDWEYPTALGSTSGDGSCKSGDTCSRSSDASNFTAMLHQLRGDSRMNVGRSGSGYTQKLISAALRANTSGDPKNIPYDYAGLNSNLNHANVMSYDDHGTWESTTNVSGPTSWAESAVQYANSNGIAAGNVVMGVPFYGPVWNNASGTGEGASGTPYETIPFRHLTQGLLGNCGSQCGTHTSGSDKWITCNGSCNFTLDGVSYATNNAWASYDDGSVVKAKMGYVATNNFGGGMYWMAGEDSTSNTLVDQMYSSLNTTGSCTPSCSGKQCGSDGCGGSCGTCSSGNTCNGNNQCVSASGGGGTGGTTGSGGCTAPAWDANVAYATNFVVSHNGSTYKCIYVTGCPAGYTPPFANIWSSGTACGTCTPNCSGKNCGSNGCGGSCGTCASGQSCDGVGQCQTSCTPQCGGKSCGANGCGGSCGTCPSGDTCNSSGQCVSSCTPSCSGKTCGPNGCGGTCGTCSSGHTCSTNGSCVSSCTPSCSGKNCGTNGCGGVCGTCSGSTPTCNSSGVCVGTTGSCSAAWAASPNPNSGYVSGTQVSDGPSGAKHNYKCKTGAAGGWCSITGTGGAYEPYFGWAWANAWDDMGACN